jgi:hypothetical protein
LGGWGIEITISGQHFEPDSLYAIYWDTPDMPIAGVAADGIGQIAGFTHTVSVSITVGVHQIIAGLNGTAVAQTPFEVTE